jgi:ABC-2 type transport system ATP-binding protein
MQSILQIDRGNFFLLFSVYISGGKTMKLLTAQIKQAGYSKETPYLQDIQFEVHSGELIGLIGANGAGKSTTIKTILGLMEYTEGETVIKEGIKYSYVPERPIFYDELTLWEHLDFIAAVEELSDQEYRKQAERLLEIYKLADNAHDYPHTYSKGMQQKAMLVLSMIINPSLYIIDEPFIGLDPNATRLFLESVEKERQKGAGILMSTHVLDTAEKVCDRFVIINKGRLAATGTMDEIRQKCGLPGGSLFDCFHKYSEEHEND